MKYKTSPLKILIGLLTIIFFLLILNSIGVYLSLSSEHNMGLVSTFIFRLFNFDLERNIPAFFSALLHLFSSILLYVIASDKKGNNHHYTGWFGLSFLFCFFALDEAAAIHEFLIDYTKEIINTSGYFYFAWVIPYGIGVILLILIYIPFFKRLNRRMLFLMFVSGGIFISGAIGLEMLGGKSMEENGINFQFMIFYTIEETLEMLGLALFIYSLFWYISNSFQKFSFKIKQNDHIKSDLKTKAMERNF